MYLQAATIRDDENFRRKVIRLGSGAFSGSARPLRELSRSFLERAFSHAPGFQGKGDRGPYLLCGIRIQGGRKILHFVKWDLTLRDIAGLYAFFKFLILLLGVDLSGELGIPFPFYFARTLGRSLVLLKPKQFRDFKNWQGRVNRELARFCPGLGITVENIRIGRQELFKPGSLRKAMFKINETREKKRELRATARPKVPLEAFRKVLSIGLALTRNSNKRFLIFRKTAAKRAGKGSILGHSFSFSDRPPKVKGLVFDNRLHFSAYQKMGIRVGGLTVQKIRNMKRPFCFLRLDGDGFLDTIFKDGWTRDLFDYYGRSVHLEILFDIHLAQRIQKWGRSKGRGKNTVLLNSTSDDIVLAGSLPDVARIGEKAVEFYERTTKGSMSSGRGMPEEYGSFFDFSRMALSDLNLKKERGRACSFWRA